MGRPLFVLSDEPAPDRGRDAERVEKAARHDERLEPFRLTAAGEVVRAHVEGLELLERPVLLPVPVEVGRRSRIRPAAYAVHGLDGHQPVGLPIRQRTKEQGVDDAEHDRVGADADRQCEQDYRRESRASPHQPQRKANVLRDRLEDREPAPIAVGVLHQLNASQLDEGLSPGLFGAHPDAAVVVDVHPEVSVELFVQLPIQAGAPKGARRTREPRPERPHDDCSPGARNRPRIADVRCQSRVSCSTRFRPARVRR
jgi:hypothetical protein